MPSGAEWLSKAQLTGAWGSARTASLPPPLGRPYCGGSRNGTALEDLEFWPKPEMENHFQVAPCLKSTRRPLNAGGQLLSGPQLIVALSPQAGEASGLTGKSAQRRMKLVSRLDLCGALLQFNRLVMHIVCPSPRLDATGPRTRAESRSGGKGLRPSEPHQVLCVLRRELGAWSTRP